MCDIVIGNDDELGVLAKNYDDGLAAARALAAEGKTVIYKMGHRGVIALTKDAEFQTGVYKVDALKPTGAGDAFMGGFLMALAAGKPLRDCVLCGSTTVAIVVTRVGCAPAMPDTAELEAFVAAHPGPETPKD